MSTERRKRILRIVRDIIAAIIGALAGGGYVSM